MKDPRLADVPAMVRDGWRGPTLGVWGDASRVTGGIVLGNLIDVVGARTAKEIRAAATAMAPAYFPPAPPGRAPRQRFVAGLMAIAERWR